MLGKEYSQLSIGLVDNRRTNEETPLPLMHVICIKNAPPKILPKSYLRSFAG